MLDLLKLRGVGPTDELELDLSPRINLFTGDNGVGKSFLLEVAWWALTRTWAGWPAVPKKGGKAKAVIGFSYDSRTTKVEREVFYDYKRQAWLRKTGRPGNPGMVLYAQVDSGFSVWDPARNYWKSVTSKAYEEPDRPPAFHFAPDSVWNGLEVDGKVLCNGLIRDWVQWQTKNGEAFQQLLRVLDKLSPSLDEPLTPGEPTRVRLDDVRDIPTLKMPYRQEVPVVHVSAAMKRVISLAYLLVWTWQEHLQASELLKQEPTRKVVFLVDEIEAHLHPRWQRVILPALIDVMSALTGDTDVEVQVLAVTHSPMLLASVEPIFDPARDALWCFDLNDDAVQVTKDAWRLRGDANSWLTSEVFDLREPRSIEAEEAITKALEILRRKDTPTRAECERVHELLQAALSDVDRFWVRWSEFMRSLEVSDDSR